MKGPASSRMVKLLHCFRGTSDPTLFGHKRLALSGYRSKYAFCNRVKLNTGWSGCLKR